VVGPALIAGLRDAQLAQGVAKNLAYDATLYVMAGLLFFGFLCNLFVSPVSERHFMSSAELTEERARQQEELSAADARDSARGPFGVSGALAWAAVGIPFAIGLFIALEKAAALF
jgi:hypothetical protein